MMVLAVRLVQSSLQSLISQISPTLSQISPTVSQIKLLEVTLSAFVYMLNYMQVICKVPVNRSCQLHVLQ